jgi:hypothetical protein
MSQVKMIRIKVTNKLVDLFLEPHILIFRRSLKVSQQVQQQRAAAAAAVAAQTQQPQYNTVHMK